MHIELDGRLLKDRAEVHDLLSRELAFPEYYGRNLDALYDLLSERTAETKILVTHVGALEANLGSYCASLLGAMRDAARHNDRLEIVIGTKDSEE